MRLKTKILTLVIACSFLLSSIPCVGADSPSIDKTPSYAELLDELGLLPDNFEYKPLQPKEIKRGDFAALVARFSGIDRYGTAGDACSFSDVRADDENYDSIMLVCKYGYMGGTGNGKFEPDQKISCYQAIKVMVSILGYDEIAKLSGGYPYGYIQQATNLGLLQNVPVTDEYTKADFQSIMTIMYNMLDAKVARYIGVSGDSALLSVGSGDTFLEYVHKITRVEGVLQALRGMSVIHGVTAAYNEVIVNEQTYKLQSYADYSHLFGYELEYYVNDDGYVVAVSDINTNSHSLFLSFDDICELDYTAIKYYDELDEEAKTSFSSSTDFVCNGMVKHIDSFADILSGDGKIKLVFTDSDRVADVVDITVANNYVVKKFNPSDKIIYDMYSSRKFEAEKYDAFDFINEFGEQMYFSELKEYDVVSAVECPDGSYAALHYSNSETEGSIDSIKVGTPSYITIDGNEYRVAKSFAQQLKTLDVGDYGIFVLDIYGNIASYSTQTGKYQYGYIATGYVKSGLDEKVVVKLLTHKGSLETLDVSDKIILDGRKCEAMETADVLCSPQLIKYYKSGDKLKAIDTLSSDAGGSGDSLATMFEGYSKDYKSVTSLRWNSYQKIFGMKIPTDDKTTVFYVPRKYSDDENDYAVKTTSVFSHDSTYYINAYSSREDSHIADVIIMYGLKSSGSVTKNTPFTMIESVSPVLGENGDETYKLYGICDGKRISGIVEDASLIEGLLSIDPDKPGKVHLLKCGDIVKLNINSENVITQIVLHYEYDSNILKENTPVATGDTKATRTLTANVYSEKGGFLQITQNPLSKAGVVLSDNEFEIINGSKYHIYKYQNENGREYAKIASLNEIIDYKSSEQSFSQIVVCGQYSNPGIIVIR